MAEKKSKDFKKQFYIKFVPTDWLQDPNVRGLAVGPKAFWIDLICVMTTFFPFGHCSKLSIQKLRDNKNLPSLKRMGVEVLVNQNSNPDHDLPLKLSVHASVEDQLQIVNNMEGDLHKFLPYTAEEVREYIRILEDEGVVSRTTGGILYSRRLHKDFRKQVQAYLNGTKGGNPKITGRKSTKNKADKSLNTSELEAPVNQTDNQNSKGDPISGDNHKSILYPITIPPQGIGLKEGAETIKGSDKKDYAVQGLLLASWEDVKDQRAILGKIGEKDFENWKRFVQWTFDTPGFRELWVAKFPNPADFTDIVQKHGFWKEKWEPVLKKLLAGGLQPHHNLTFRIPEYIGYTYKSKQEMAHVDTGGENFTGQEGW